MNEALDLWIQYFKTDDGPTVEHHGEYYCFFCGGAKIGLEQTHTSDCVYVRAKQLVEAQGAPE